MHVSCLDTDGEIDVHLQCMEEHSLIDTFYNNNCLMSLLANYHFTRIRFNVISLLYNI